MTIALAAAAIASWSTRPADVPQPLIRFSIALDVDSAAQTPVVYGPRLAIAPDGQRIAFVGPSALERQIYVRALSDPTPRQRRVALVYRGRDGRQRRPILNTKSRRRWE